MAGVEGNANYPTDDGSRHALGTTADAGSTFRWFRSTLVNFFLKVVNPAAPSIALGNVDIPTTAGGTLLLAANANRRVAWLFNDGSARVYVGPTGLTSTANSYPLEPKSQIPWEADDAIYALSSSGTQKVYYMETYD